MTGSLACVAPDARAAVQTMAKDKPSEQMRIKCNSASAIRGQTLEGLCTVG
jgi:hypothetical protein